MEKILPPGSWVVIVPELLSQINISRELLKLHPPLFSQPPCGAAQMWTEFSLCRRLSDGKNLVSKDVYNGFMQPLNSEVFL